MMADSTTHLAADSPTRKTERLRAYDWQLLLRGVAVALYAALLASYEWRFLTGSTAFAGMMLLAAGAIGLISLFRGAGGVAGRWLRGGDAVVDLAFGGILVACAIGNPAAGPVTFGIWAAVAGLLLIIHAVPSRLRDVGPAWAWIWTGAPLVLLGVAVLAYPSLDPVWQALRLNALALGAATMLIMLGFGLAYTYVLALPEEDSSGETMFSYDDVHWRTTPSELQQHDLEEKPGRAA
jgi:uncharacterized membrane protein HdeD (DUF308 family)